ncbi:hypothetical protein ABMX86_22675 [Vibrio vulnificus]|uniref:hypothetical protein n=1 Tax=Vibrio vulnificus TaxID=672 RepID=UPI003ED8C150
MFFISTDENMQHGNNLCGELRRLLEQNKSLFEYSLIPNLAHINRRAENHNGIEIQDVTYVRDNEYLLEYSYQWYVYNGCSNLDVEGEEDSSILFTINDDGEIEFEDLPFEERHTHEEF